jgi:hypothetical protein
VATLISRKRFQVCYSILRTAIGRIVSMAVICPVQKHRSVCKTLHTMIPGGSHRYSTNTGTKDKEKTERYLMFDS